jgi:hypothetical protein
VGATYHFAELFLQKEHILDKEYFGPDECTNAVKCESLLSLPSSGLGERTALMPHQCVSRQP